MAMPRIDWQPTDYSDRISSGLGQISKVANDYSPAHPLMAQAIRRIYGGEDPRTVAIETKFAMARQQQPPNLPDAGMPASGGSPMPPATSSRAEFTGPREVSSEETVVAPPQALRSPGMPLQSEPSTDRAFYSQAQPPILNRDLPVLMQGAGLVNKDNKTDLGYLNYLLGRDRLGWDQSKHGDMEVHRGIRDEATKANTAEIPIRRQLAQERLGVSKFNAQTSRGSLDTRRTENYLKGAGPSIVTANALEELVREGSTVPGVQIPSSDYTARRSADIVEKLPLIGNFAAEFARNKADEQLTQAQLNYRRRVAEAMAEYIHGKYGANFTAHELRLAQMISGEQLSFADTLAGLSALSRSLRAGKADLYQRGYQDVAGQIGSGTTPKTPPSELPPVQRTRRLNAADYGAKTQQDLELLRRQDPGIDWYLPGLPNLPDAGVP